MRIIGIDPGTVKAGWGVIQLDGGTVLHVAHGVITATAGHTLQARLRKMAPELREKFVVFAPQEAAIERCFVGRYPNAVLGLGRALGVFMAVSWEFGLEPTEYEPMVVKRAVAGGNATKAKVQQRVKLVLGLADTPPEDAADALAVAICHANRLFVAKNQKTFF